ncbi:MAG: T9SS type A sorting domain-containing protein [Bacteroidota bacterium]
MKKDLLIGLVFSLFPLGLIAQYTQLPSPNSTSVMGGEYNVMNNVWGASTAQTLEVDLNGTYFRVILSEHNNTGGTPAAYPAIFKGNHYGWATTKNNPMPIRIDEIDSAPFTWIIDTTGVSGTYNCAYESFFSDLSTGSNYKAELMIWINYRGGANPGGSIQDTVEIGGRNWVVYYALWDWNYIAYKLIVPTDSVSLDLKDFLRDALTRGYLFTSWYLHNMEAGFEIWRNGQGLATLEYSATVIPGSFTDNFAPTPFNLIYPSNSKVLTSWGIPFRWQTSVDANTDPVEYIFHLFGSNMDTTITQLYDDSLYFDASNCLLPNTYYTWSVKATDGIDTTSSTSQRTFRTPKEASGIDQTDKIPGRYSLSQNYPNPFNPQTTISYSLPRASCVTLRIYDPTGREIATLINNERKAAGNYEVSFDATELSSGVYFYRLSTENFTEVKSMVLIK